MRGFARKLTLNFRVEKVWQDRGKWCVSDGHRIKTYDQIVSTIPIEDLLDALPETPEEVRCAVRGLRYNSLTLVMLGAGVRRRCRIRRSTCPTRRCSSIACRSR